MPTLDVLISSEEIHARIQQLAAQIDLDYPKGPVYLVTILKGACIFM